MKTITLIGGPLAGCKREVNWWQICYMEVPRLTMEQAERLKSMDKTWSYKWPEALYNRNEKNKSEFIFERMVYYDIHDFNKDYDRRKAAGELPK